MIVRNLLVSLFSDPVSHTEQAINSIRDDFLRKCTIRTSFVGHNIGAARQFLLLFRLKGFARSPIAQFFIGAQFVRAEAITQSTYDDVAILLDAPGNANVNTTVRLATPDNRFDHGFHFMGLDCYLL